MSDFANSDYRGMPIRGDDADDDDDDDDDDDVDDGAPLKFVPPIHKPSTVILLDSEDACEKRIFAIRDFEMVRLSSSRRHSAPSGFKPMGQTAGGNSILVDSIVFIRIDRPEYEGAVYLPVALGEEKYEVNGVMLDRVIPFTLAALEKLEKGSRKSSEIRKLLDDKYYSEIDWEFQGLPGLVVPLTWVSEGVHSTKRKQKKRKVEEPPVEYIDPNCGFEEELPTPEDYRNLLFANPEVPMVQPMATRLNQCKHKEEWDCAIEYTVKLPCGSTFKYVKESEKRAVWSFC